MVKAIFIYLHLTYTLRGGITKSEENLLPDKEPVAPVNLFYKIYFLK